MVPTEREFSSAPAKFWRRDVPTADFVAEELREKVREMAGGGSLLKAAWPTIARATGLSEGQIKRLAYGEWRNVPAHVYLRVILAYRNHLERVEAQMLHQAAIVRARAEEHDLRWAELSARESISRSSDMAPTSNGARSE